MNSKPDPNPAPKIADSNHIITTDGIRIPVNVIKKMKDVTESVFHNALLEAYEGEDPKFWGKTKLEAGMSLLADRVSAGDTTEINKVLDRVLGLPKQSTENVNVNANTTLAEFLKTIHNKETPGNNTNTPPESPADE